MRDFLFAEEKAALRMNRLLMQAETKDESTKFLRNLCGLRDVRNEPILPLSFHLRYRLGQGETRAYWNGPAVRHPGYACAASGVR